MARLVSLYDREIPMEKYQVSENYLLREICGEYTIIPVGEAAMINNAMLTPNETAVTLWKLFQEPRTEEEVVAGVLAEFDAPEEVISDDVHRFVGETVKYGLLKEV